jgi:hypothetical protein
MTYISAVIQWLHLSDFSAVPYSLLTTVLLVHHQLQHQAHYVSMEICQGLGYQPSPIESLVYEWKRFLLVSSQLPYSNINFSYGFSFGSKWQIFDPACRLKNVIAPFLDSGPPTVCPSESIKNQDLAFSDSINYVNYYLKSLNLWLG